MGDIHDVFVFLLIS